MFLRLHAAREALKLGLVVGAFATLAGVGDLAGAKTAPIPRPRIALVTAPAPAASVTPDALTAATGTVDVPAEYAAEEPGRRLAATETDYGKARRMNAALQLSTAPILAARPFTLTGGAGDKARALTCLTQAVYYEAGYEPDAGQRAVAQVVLNRMRHPLFPHSVCGVVFQGAVTPGGGCQFSFTCDGSLGRGQPPAAAWRRAQAVAKAALAGHVEAPVGTATHYHADYVAPYWMTTVVKLARVGQHIFYRWPGALGLPQAFAAHYAAAEAPPALPVLMAAAAARGKAAVVAAPVFRPGPGVSLGADGAIYVAQADDAAKDGRVHARFLTGETPAAAEPATPQARRAAVLAGRSEIAGGLETLAPAAAADVPAAPPAAPAAGEN